MVVPVVLGEVDPSVAGLFVAGSVVVVVVVVDPSADLDPVPSVLVVDG